MIEIVSAARCIRCDSCIAACPDNVFDRSEEGLPVIARLDDCQTCFLCELYCPVDALYVSPLKDGIEGVEEETVVASGLMGSYRRGLGWRGIKAAGSDGDLSHRLPEADGRRILRRSPTKDARDESCRDTARGLVDGRGQCRCGRADRGRRAGARRLRAGIDRPRTRGGHARPCRATFCDGRGHSEDGALRACGRGGA